MRGIRRRRLGVRGLLRGRVGRFMIICEWEGFLLGDGLVLRFGLAGLLISGTLEWRCLFFLWELLEWVFTFLLLSVVVFEGVFIFVCNTPPRSVGRKAKPHLCPPDIREKRQVSIYSLYSMSQAAPPFPFFFFFIPLFYFSVSFFFLRYKLQRPDVFYSKWFFLYLYLLFDGIEESKSLYYYAVYIGL